MMILLFDNNTLELVLQRLHILSLSVNEQKNVTSFAVEDGSVRSDHAYDEQLEIVLVCTYGGEASQTIYSELKHLYDTGKLLTVATRNTVHKDMILSAIPREEPAELANATVISLVLKQWKDVKAREGTFTISEVANPQQSDTVAGGVKQGVPVSDASVERPRLATNDKTPKHIQDSINRAAGNSAQISVTNGILKGVQGR